MDSLVADAGIIGSQLLVSSGLQQPFFSFTVLAFFFTKKTNTGAVTALGDPADGVFILGVFL